MRLVSQNVREAAVTIGGRLSSAIGKGLLLLVSFAKDDDEEIVRKMAGKVAALRIFPDENGKTNLSLGDTGGEILSVPQFTLYASVRGGRRPAFTASLEPKEASRLFDYFNDCLKDLGLRVSSGVFGADMDVSLVNEGPFTLILDSKELFS